MTITFDKYWILTQKWKWFLDYATFKGQQVQKTSIKRNVPQSSNPLKSFNWSKLPECKVEGTIWKDMGTEDENKLYKALDLAEVDKLFSAYQKNGTLSIEGNKLFHLI